ncbi:MAG: DNA helicase RecQ [Burkholderiaceae bacterium]|nr:DNA helicase RecQ [Burkholderiaceae bacterium]
MSVALSILREVFGYQALRGPQAEIIDHVISGGDALVLMPTGGGKSLCYQIPAIARHRAGQGVTVVISPLIALMQDQVGALHEVGVEAAFLNSTLSGEAAYEVEQRLRRAEFTLLYAAPERVNTPRFLALLDSLQARGLLSLFAIDEAHCVSQWGHDFRPEYRALNLLHERYAKVPRLALTATADALTRTDMVERLQLMGARLFVSSFDRPNLRYTIVEKKDPFHQLLRFVQHEHAGSQGCDSGIVYCQSRKRVEDVASRLSEAGLPALPYHAGLDIDTRQRHQDRFLREDGLIMVATIAFGMGIDKPDVRFVAHLDMPKNIEGYYQETGRAGRDGLPANAWMCYGLQDVVQQRRMIDESPASEAFRHVMRGKLEALLTLADSIHCRRERLLAFFGETAAPPGAQPASPEDSATGARWRCMNCDNCLTPAQVWDGTDAALKLLSAVYRVQQHSGFGFGAGHIMDIVRGKSSDKVVQFGHATLSTFGVGANYSEPQLRGVLRQLLALGALAVDAQAYQTLQLTEGSRRVLKGQQPVVLRLPAKTAVSVGAARTRRSAQAAIALDGIALARYDALKAWRGEVARAHNLPAYVIFHDATLQAIAQTGPTCEAELLDISGIGQQKRQAYGAEVLRVVSSVA